MKTWIAKIRITDDGETSDSTGKYLPADVIKEMVTNRDLIAGLETDVISIEEEVEHPKE